MGGWTPAAAAVLIALLPTIATSKLVTSRIESAASEKMRRPVHLDGLAFGWFTELRIGRLELGALPSEENHPVIALRDVHVPITLSRVLRLPPYSLSGIKVGKLEANMVRDKSGQWSVMELASHFPPAKQAPPSSKAHEAVSLPISSLGVTVEHLELNVQDYSTSHPLAAGLTEGSFSMDWPGNSADLTTHVQGTLHANATNHPAALKVVVSKWILDKRILSLPTMHVKAWTGAEESVDGGGFFFDGGATDGVTSRMRTSLDLAWLESFLVEALPDRELPKVAGMARMDVAATPSQNGNLWNLATSLKTDSISVTSGTMLLLPDTDSSASLVYDMPNNRIESLHAGTATPALSASLEAAGLQLGPEPDWTKLESAGSLNLGELSRLGATFLGHPQDIDPVSGEISWRISAPPGNPHGPLHANAFVSWSNGALNTMEPFARDPAWLAGNPWDLAETSTTLEAAIELDRSARRLNATTIRVRSSLATMDAEASFGLEKPAEQLQAKWKLSTDLAAIHQLLAGRFIPEELSALSGTITTEGDARADGALLASHGSFESSAVELSWLEKKIVGGNLDSSLHWDLVADLPSKSVDIREATVATTILQGSAKGTASARKFDIESSSTLNLHEAMTLASTFSPMDMESSGTITTLARVFGETSGTLTSSLEISGSPDLEIRVPGKGGFAGPIAATSEIVSKVSPSGTRAVELISSTLVLGEVADFATHGTALLGASPSYDFATSGTLHYGPLMALADPAVLAPAGELHLDGFTDLILHVVGGAPTTPCLIDGRAETKVASLQWALGDKQVELGGLRDVRSFGVKLAPSDPRKALYSDSAETTLDAMEGPKGISLHGLRLSAEAEGGLDAPIRYRLMPSSFETLGWTTDTLAVLLPHTNFELDTSTTLATRTFAIPHASYDMSEVSSGSLTLSLNYGTLAWEASGRADLADLGVIMGMVSGSKLEGMAIPTIKGGTAASFDFRSGGTSPDSSALPVDGVAVWDLNGLNVENADRTLVRNAWGHVRIDAENSLLSAAGALRIDHVGLDPASPLKSVDGILLKGGLRLTGMDSLAGAGDLAIDSLGIHGDGSISMDNLARVRQAPPGRLKEWLRTVPIEANANVAMELAAIDNLMPDLVAAGDCSTTLQLSNHPDRALDLRWDIETAEVHMGMNDVALLEGVSGNWSARKTYYAERNRVAPAVQDGRFVIERFVFAHPPIGGTVQDMIVNVRGFDGGVSADTTTQNFLGGPARSAWRLELSRGDPVFSGEAESTGFNGRTLFPRFQYVAVEEGEINSRSKIRWRLRDGLSAATALDDLSFSTDATKIGRQALTEILNGLDPAGSDPAFQSAKAAMRLGTPVGGRFSLDNGLMSMSSSLRVAGGSVVQVPILDRAPVGQLLGVYKTHVDPAMLATARRYLLLLLSADQDELQRLVEMNTEAAKP